MDGEERSSANLHFPTKEAPWMRTFLTQAALCFLLFVALNIGRPQIKVPDSGDANGFGPSTDFYFVSVAGGSRPIEAQSKLLKQMGMVAKIYKPKFVLNIGQIGEEDPLWSNATLHPALLKMPWYTTTASKGRGIGNFMKKIELPYGQVPGNNWYRYWVIPGNLTALCENFLRNEINNTDFKEQIDWLRRTLAITSSDWRIVAGFNLLVICDQQNNKGAAKLRGLFRDIFLRYRVNAYLSTNGCSNFFYNNKGTKYIENPPTDKFLLHGVSPLEIKTFLVDSEGRVELKYSFTQHGREAI